MTSQKKSSFSGLMSFFKKDKFPPQDSNMTEEEKVEEIQVKDSTNKNYDIKKGPPLLGDRLANNLSTEEVIWEYPPLSLLNKYKNKERSKDQIQRIAMIIEQTAMVFGLQLKVVEANSVIFYDQFLLKFLLADDMSKILNLTDEFAYALDISSHKVKILRNNDHNKRDLMAIEVASDYPVIPSLRSVLGSNILSINHSKLAVGLGLDISTRPVVVNIAKLPHLLVTGTTDSGISNLVHSIISILLFRASPAEIKFILIDPKRVELTNYNDIPHLMTPVVVDVEKILASLMWATDEMDRRYKIFAEKGVRNIDSFNRQVGFRSLPYIVIIIDGIEDIMMFAPIEVEDAIVRLVQMAALAGIHLILASKESKKNQIKSMFNLFSSRITVNNSSSVGRNILNYENDGIPMSGYSLTYFAPDEVKPFHLNSVIVSEDEIKRLVDFLKGKNPSVEYTEETVTAPLALKKTGSMDSDGKDPLLEGAIRTVCQYDRVSVSTLQRRLSIGYARAARILDQLEDTGVVGHAEGSKPRDVLTKNAEEIIDSLLVKG